MSLHTLITSEIFHEKIKPNIGSLERLKIFYGLMSDFHLIKDVASLIRR